MLDFSTTPTGEVRPVKKQAHQEHPHPTSLWGVGVWCGGRNVEYAGGGDRLANTLKLQTGYMWVAHT